MSDKAVWRGHEFTVYPRDADWNEVAGLYVFAGLLKDHQGRSVWHSFYVGRCQSFAGYIPTHRKWSAAELLGATHVHAMTVKNAKQRDEIERDLIQFYQPALNVQLRQ